MQAAWHPPPQAYNDLTSEVADKDYQLQQLTAAAAAAEAAVAAVPQQQQAQQESEVLLQQQQREELQRKLAEADAALTELQNHCAALEDEVQAYATAAAAPAAPAADAIAPAPAAGAALEALNPALAEGNKAGEQIGSGAMVDAEMAEAGAHAVAVEECAQPEQPLLQQQQQQQQEVETLQKRVLALQQVGRRQRAACSLPQGQAVF